MRTPSLIKLIATPRLRGAALIRAASRGGWKAYIWRNLLMSLHGCDVSTKFAIEPDLHVPHPVGIVIGEGVKIGRGVTIYHDVTLGRDRSGEYPVIEDGACIMPGAIIIGGVTVGRNAVIGAHAVVTQSVPDDHVLLPTADSRIAPLKQRHEQARGWPYL